MNRFDIWASLIQVPHAFLFSKDTITRMPLDIIITFTCKKKSGNHFLQGWVILFYIVEWLASPMLFCFMNRWMVSRPVLLLSDNHFAPLLWLCACVRVCACACTVHACMHTHMWVSVKWPLNPCQIAGWLHWLCCFSTNCSAQGSVCVRLCMCMCVCVWHCLT